MLLGISYDLSDHAPDEMLESKTEISMDVSFHLSSDQTIKYSRSQGTGIGDEAVTKQRRKQN